MAQTNWTALSGPAATNSDLSVAQNADGRLEIFLISDNTLWHSSQLEPGKRWSDWASLNRPPNVNALNRLVVQQNADGRLETFTLGSDEALWHIWQTSPGGDWSQWFSSGHPSVGNGQDSLAIQKNADGRLEVFTVGTDGALWHIWQTTPNGTWSNWTSLNKPYNVETLFGLAAGKNADGRLEVFAIDLDGTLWHTWQLEPAKGGWHQWSSLGQPTVGNNVFLAAVTQNVDGRLEVFTIGADPDRAPWHIWQNTPNGPWSTWASLGRPPNTGGVISPPSVARNKDGHLEAFVTSSDGALWHIWQVIIGKSWGTWDSLGTPPTITINNYPLLVSENADGRLEVFAAGSDGVLWHAWQVKPGGNWSSF